MAALLFAAAERARVRGRTLSGRPLESGYTPMEVWTEPDIQAFPSIMVPPDYPGARPPPDAIQTQATPGAIPNSSRLPTWVWIAGAAGLAWLIWRGAS